jgi:kumamolisin
LVRIERGVVAAAMAMILGVSLQPAHSGASATRFQPTRTQNPYVSLLRDSRDLGPLNATHPIRFVATLRSVASPALRAKLAAVSNPRSPAYGHYLSPAQYAAGMGPSRVMVRGALGFLSRHGLHGSWTPGQAWMTISGSAGAVERVFRVRIERYRARSGARFYAARHDPVPPASLHAVVTGIGHISSYGMVRPESIQPGGLTPSDLVAAYDIKPLRSRGLNGSGQTISFIEIDGYYQSDLTNFANHFNLPPLRPQIANGVQLSNVEGEAELDLEVVHEIAPGARLRVYNCPNGCSSADLVAIESHAVRDNPRGIVSVSIGACESAAGRGDAGAESSAFSPTGALGVSVFVASGDNGAYTCLDQDWGAPPGPDSLGVSIPASVPGVTAVGGTRLSLRSNAQWYREEVWAYPADTSGSGGGRSVYFGRPSWQQGRGTGGSRRQVPDVSAAADPLTSARVVIDGNLTEAGGTSQAAPIWAGMTALINQYLKKQGRPVVGFLNPALYSLASGSPRYPPFHDVTLGTNLAYPAAPGYDMATGLGTPDAWNLARDLAAQRSGGG